MTIQLPFPQGFDPNVNKDVTFEVIHYKDGGVNEKNTVVVSHAGMLITVSSFSPFRIQPKQSSALKLDEIGYPLYTSAFGGSPTVTINDEDIKNQVKEYKLGQKISIKPPKGTRIEKVFLNSKSLDKQSFENMELTLEDGLNPSSNNLEVHIITYKVLEEEYVNKINPIHYTADISTKSQSEAAKKFDLVIPVSEPIDSAAMVDPSLDGKEPIYSDDDEKEIVIPDDLNIMNVFDVDFKC